MKRTVVMFMIFSLLLAVTACSTGVAGTYVSGENSSDYLKLKSNGTFNLKEGGMKVTGNYEVEGDELTLSFDMGVSVRGKIQGNTIIDPDGDQWVKK